MCSGVDLAISELADRLLAHGRPSRCASRTTRACSGRSTSRAAGRRHQAAQGHRLGARDPARADAGRPARRVARARRRLIALASERASQGRPAQLARRGADASATRRARRGRGRRRRASRGAPPTRRARARPRPASPVRRATRGRCRAARAGARPRCSGRRPTGSRSALAERVVGAGDQLVGLDLEQPGQQRDRALPGIVMPASRCETATREIAERSASSCWVRPSLARCAAMRRPRFSRRFFAHVPTHLADGTRLEQRRTSPWPHRALITGITGQDGSYLAELLLDKGYEVIGMVRRSSTVNFERIAPPPGPASTFVPGDLLDEVSLIEILREHRPDEVYNLAAQSLRADVVRPAGAHRRDHRPRRDPPARRHPHRRPRHPLLPGQLERDVRQGRRGAADARRTPFYPRSPYGVAKVYGHWITVNYRESYDLHATQRHPVQPRVAPARPRVRRPARSPTASPGSSSASTTSCASATSRPGATGASPATTSRPCG